MKSNGNQSQRIYDKTTRSWYEVPEDQYREFDRWRTNLRKREQYWGAASARAASGGLRQQLR